MDQTLGQTLLNENVREVLKGRGLSLSQLDVLERMCDGKTNRQIGVDLSMIEKAIKAQVTYLNKRLGTKSRALAVALVTRLFLELPRPIATDLPTGITFDDLRL